MIRTRGLTKTYGDVRAVDDVDLDVREGDVYGFLGANGSGKTTTVRMLLGLVLANDGEAELFGEPMPTVVGVGAPPGRRAGRGTGRLPAPVRPRQPRPLRRRRPVRAYGAPIARARIDRGARAGRARPGRQASDEGLLARHAATARARCRARCADRPCSCSTSRPTGSTRRASATSASCSLGLNRGGHHDLPLQPPARRDRADVHPGRRARPRTAGAAGGHVRASARSPGWSACAPPTSARPSRCSTAGSSSAATARSSYAPTTPPTSTSELVTAGVRVTGLEPVRRTLEQVVLESDARHDPGRAGQAAAAAAHVGDHRRAQRAAHAGRGPARASPTSARVPAADRRSCPPCSPTARCSRSPRWASCCRCSCRWPSRSSVATRSPARCRATPCATCSCARSRGCGC